MFPVVQGESARPDVFSGVSQSKTTDNLAPTPRCDARRSPLDLTGRTACPLYPDIVAKVENRTVLKISRKLIFGLLCRCVAFQSHYGGP